ncbi:hypothetical protein OIU77_012831 [Salix suchowensis]|uniref:Uncharacterized protein n=1 Tax=Salix suchowensis TaxID=1278906 RepID=A0ABQ9A571_9ROSI|nr:hypothetical protein OIU77_012831 [Salix suchowensis]
MAAKLVKATIFCIARLDLLVGYTCVSYTVKEDRFLEANKAGTGDFKPNPGHPFVDLSGRLFRVRMVKGKNVIYVGCGFGMVSAAAARQQMLDLFDIAGIVHFDPRAIRFSSLKCCPSCCQIHRQSSGEINSMQNAYKKGLLASSVRAAKESKVQQHGLKSYSFEVNRYKGSEHDNVTILKNATEFDNALTTSAPTLKSIGLFKEKCMRTRKRGGYVSRHSHSSD